MTIREVYLDRIDAAQDADDCRRLFEQMVTLCVADGGTREIAAQNVGYLLGYYGQESKTAAMWFAALPEVMHPVFGPDYGRGDIVTPDRALADGIAMGAKMKREAQP